MNKQKMAKRRLPSFIRWILWVLLVQFVLINIMAGLYAHRLTHFYNDPSLASSTISGNIFTKTWKLFTGPKQPRTYITERPVFPYDTVILTTKKGLKIEAWYSAVDSAAKGTVILFHGIIINKGRLIDEAYEFRYWGYNVMMVDFRGHGGSEGNTTTIGVRESEEVKLAYDYVTQKGGKNIVLFGTSMGAVAVAKAISDYSLQPSGVILEMPFQSLQTYLKGRARILGFPQQPFAFLTTFWVGAERGFNGYKHNTIHYAKNIKCPVLVQCGAKDAFVLLHESEAVYNAIPSVHKKLVIYETAQHESFLRNDQKKWRIEVEEFLKRNEQQNR
jgi:alpha-beta hydrolase superfamily lysophospholipase